MIPGDALVFALASAGAVFCGLLTLHLIRLDAGSILHMAFGTAVLTFIAAWWSR
jgi:hypothetical protein